MPITVEPQVILAHRKSGELYTVSHTEADRLLTGGNYFLVCREPENCPPSLTDEEQIEKYARLMDVSIRHHHNSGIAEPGCPQLHTLELLPIDQWQANDVAGLNEFASDVLGCSQFLRWDVQTRIDRRRKVAEQTTIEIFDGTLGTRYPTHVLVVRCPGFMSASARTWLQQQAERSGLAVIVPATPSPRESQADEDDGPSGKIERIARQLREVAASLKDADGEDYSSADFDQLLVRVRTLIANDPARAARLDQYAVQLLNEVK